MRQSVTVAWPAGAARLRVLTAVPGRPRRCGFDRRARPAAAGRDRQASQRVTVTHADRHDRPLPPGPPGTGRAAASLRALGAWDRSPVPVRVRLQPASECRHGPGAPIGSSCGQRSDSSSIVTASRRPARAGCQLSASDPSLIPHVLGLHPGGQRDWQLDSEGRH